ncbi:MAG: ABC transporter substrate-binding protein [Xanthobacteraceae bacterium]
MGELSLSFACLPYDRFQPLLSGEVRIEGANLVPMTSRWPLEIFSRMLTHNEFDVAEMSITHAFVLTAAQRANFVVLPIFPSRAFRHGFIFINRKAGIQVPKDLEGKTIGIQGHQATAAVWIRGILRKEHNVAFDDVNWVEGGVNHRGLKGGSAAMLRPNRPISVRRIRDDQMLSEMLATGEIDALINPEIPDSLKTSADVERLFPGYHALEREYYRRTGVFPIMHVLVMKRELHEQHRWLASSIFRACQAAKMLALKQAHYSGALAYMLPWLHESLEELDELFGDDPWPYGLQSNRQTLETYAQILLDEGFLSAPARIEDIFVPVEE